jgi:hypothetical protein
VAILLGDHQDSVVSRAHLSQEATVAHGAGEDTFTYGVLFEQEAELARRSEEQLDDALSASRGRHQFDRDALCHLEAARERRLHE